jgi:uncharacterized membrane protein YgcG
MTRSSDRRKRSQGGYALLFVFAMAAASLVMLYLEMPRVAFEHQRDKEALLVERGEEYVRAIQLYVQKFNKYPQSLEELETTNNIRFLRKRFRDPITGSDEWRLIHIDAAGQFVDSLVYKRQEQKRESAPHVLQSNVQGIGVSAQVITPDGQAQAQNPALRRTASDRIIPGMPGQGGGEAREQGEEAQPQEENAPPPPEAQAPPQPGAQTPIRGEPGSPGAAPGQNPFRMPGNVPPGQPGMPGQQRPDGQAPPSIGQPAIGYGGGIGSVSASPPPAPGVSGGLAPGMAPPQSLQTGMTGPAPGMGAGGGQRPGAPNEALQAIQRILTRQPAQGGAPAGGMAIGGGIAGVASKADMEGIRVYNERTNYKEWEFLFDFRKAMQAAGIGAGQPGTQPGMPGQGQQRQSSPFETPGGPSSGGFSFGGSSSSGGRGSFGSGIGFGQPQPAPPPRP